MKIKSVLALYLALCGVLHTTATFADDWFYPLGNPERRDARITQGFMNGNPYHQGTDLGRPVPGQGDATVRAISRGRVIYIGTGYNVGWGNTIVLRHDALNAERYVFSSYSHLDSISVNRGDLVQGGQPIGVMGSTGNSTAPHLHFQVFTKDNGNNPWDGFGVADLGVAYPTQSQVPRGYTPGYLYKRTGTEVHHYDGIVFIDFMRNVTIASPSIQTYSVNGDSSSSSPASLSINTNNTVKVTVSVFRKDIVMHLALRDYENGRIAGDMTLVRSDPGTWFIGPLDIYNRLGNNLSDGGWNRESLLTYQYTFNAPTPSNSVGLAVFWRPKNYSSDYLILTVPGGAAHNTIGAIGRYVYRPVQ